MVWKFCFETNFLTDRFGMPTLVKAIQDTSESCTKSILGCTVLNGCDLAENVVVPIINLIVYIRSRTLEEVDAQSILI